MNFPPMPTEEELKAIRQRLKDAGDTKEWWELEQEREVHQLANAEFRGEKC